MKQVIINTFKQQNISNIIKCYNISVKERDDNMTVQQFLDKEKPKKYIITDRMRTPLKEEQLKWLDLSDIEIRTTDVLADDTVRIHSDYMPDAC